MKMNLQNLLKNSLRRSDFSSQLCTKPDFQKSVQVCVLGANTRLGTFTSFLAKQNPLISTLHLQGCFPIENMGNDLNFFDTRCRVRTYCGLEQSVSKAVKSADIVVILPTEGSKPDTPLGERVMKEGKRVSNIAAQCTVYAPRAVLVVCVPPVSVTTPLVAEVFKKTNFYHPGRIVGSAALAQVTDRKHSTMEKIEHFPGKSGSMAITARFRGVKEEDFPKKLGNPNYIEDCPLAESYALNQLISTIASGICGDPHAFANVFVRCGAVDISKYLVSTVRFSRGGVVHNFGVPPLSKLELELVERSALQIKEREQMALDYLKYIEAQTGKSELPLFAKREKLDHELLKQKVIR
ncbi:malate dehydrogenase, mitochondrial isoform X2 [Dendroctonus ponderosae]|uniref:malate dehydrogenase, mitochondrial isoform X2 n=1 Tax=Dendroctonus ponderosae TaxID=77166 RepID=UPI002035B638|nr:malate dehydrogenase, mitochondrial isoform X2 [Dendroctonus ponderosae]